MRTRNYAARPPSSSDSELSAKPSLAIESLRESDFEARSLLRGDWIIRRVSVLREIWSEPFGQIVQYIYGELILF